MVYKKKFRTCMIKVKRLEELEENKMEKEKIALEGD